MRAREWGSQFERRVGAMVRDRAHRVGLAPLSEVLVDDKSMWSSSSSQRSESDVIGEGTAAPGVAVSGINQQTPTSCRSGTCGSTASRSAVFSAIFGSACSLQR